MDDIPWGPDHPLYLDAAEEFFGTNPSADFDRWSAVQFWTLEEGVALSFGFDPRVVNSRVMRNCPEHPFAAEFDRRLDLARRAVDGGRLSTRSPPGHYIRWAKGRGITFPDGLVQAVKSLSRTKSTNSTTTSPSGLKILINKSSEIALGMADYVYGFNPAQPHEQEYEHIVADLHDAGIAVTVESVRRCLKPHDDLYENLPEVGETLGKVVLGIAIIHFQHDPKARRSRAPNLIATALEASGGEADEDTIRARLKKAAGDLGLA